MKKIHQLLDEKGREVFSLAPGDTVFRAIELMAEKGVGALAVVEGEALVGIVSERDYARKVILKGRSSRETSIRDIMTSPVVTTSPESSVDDCMGLMTGERIRHLPVLEGKRLAGMISIGDLVKAIIADQRFQIEQLERYISS